MASNEFSLVLLIMLIFVLVVFVMSYVSVRAYNSLWFRGKELVLGILLAVVWFVALSLCSVPVFILVPLSNAYRGLSIGVIESQALMLAVCMGLVMSRTEGQASA